MSLRAMHGLAVLIVFAVLAAGCGGLVRVAYNNGDWAVRWAAHDYLDLHGVQSDVFRDHLERFHAWHRATELPQYAVLATGAGDRMERGLARDDVTWGIERVRARYRALAERAIAEIAPVVLLLGPSNIAALERKLEESTQKWEKEYLRGSPERRERARLKTMVKRIEDFTGPLNRSQIALVTAYVRESPHYSDARLADRRARQRALVEIIREHRRSADLVPRLRAHFVTYDRDRGPEYAAFVTDWEERLVRLVLDLDRSLTREQRVSVIAKFDQLANDFNILAGRPEEPRGTQRRAAMAQ